jgi:predicted nucleic acid-binding protein
MYTVDASVWVNGFDQREPGHAISRQVLDLLRAQGIPIVVPNLVLAEVAGAISRTRNNPAQAQAFAAALGRLPNVRLVPLDNVLIQQAQALAASHGLRGADAIYAAVALQAGSILISLDNEHLTRLTGIVTTRTPADTLVDLTPP